MTPQDPIPAGHWSDDPNAVSRMIQAIDAHSTGNLIGWIIALRKSGDITEYAEKVILAAHHEQFNAVTDLVLRCKTVDEFRNAKM